MSKIDELIAEHVLEWRKEGSKWKDASGTPVELPRFSEDIAAAWTVVDPICDRGFRLQLEGGRLWRAKFYKSMAHTLETNAFAGTAGNAPEAICKAALAVKGVSV